MNVNPNKYMLIYNAVPKTFQDEVAKGIKSVGRSGSYAIKAQNLIYVLAEKTSDVWPAAKHVTPRGYPDHITWDDIPACSTDDDIVGLFSKPTNDGMAAAVRHETGHILDISFVKIIGERFTNTKGYTDAYLSDLLKLKERLSNEKIKDEYIECFNASLEYFTQGSTPQEATEAGKQETFADIYAKLRGVNPFDRGIEGIVDKIMDRLFPNTISYVQKLLYLLGDK